MAPATGQADLVEAHERNGHRLECRLGVGGEEGIPARGNFIRIHALPIEGNPERLTFFRFPHQQSVYAFGKCGAEDGMPLGDNLPRIAKKVGVDRFAEADGNLRNRSRCGGCGLVAVECRRLHRIRRVLFHGFLLRGICRSPRLPRRWLRAWRISPGHRACSGTLAGATSRGARKSPSPGCRA